jgi:hypothetical protein
MKAQINEMGKAFFEFIAKARANNCKVLLIMQEKDETVISSFGNCNNLSEIGDMLMKERQSNPLFNNALIQTENRTFSFKEN